MPIIPSYLTNGTVLNQFEKIRQYVESPTISILTPGNRKNLLHIEIESLELQMIGKWSKYCRNSCQYLQKLSDEGLFNENFRQDESVKMTIQSRYASETGLPLVHPYGIQHWKKWKPHSLPEILKLAGYNCLTFIGGNPISFGQEFMLENFGYQTNFHLDKSDFSIYNMIKRNIVPNLNHSPTPWLIMIEMTGTHLGLALDFQSCKKRVSSNCEDMHQSFDCADQLLEMYLNLFKRNGLLNNTEVIIAGDHKYPINFQFVGERLQGMWIPTQPKNDSKRWKQISVLDYLPTVLDLLDLKIWPMPPYGESLLSANDGNMSAPDDRRFLFSLIQKHGFSDSDFREYGTSSRENDY